MLAQIKNSIWFIKWSHWEYWPMWFVYLPVLPIIFYYALKTRRFFFFSNVNPLFKTGALMGASKYDILKQIPNQFLPRTLFISKEDNDFPTLLERLEYENLSFPLIVKPDVGERGLLVALLKTKDELEDYMQANNIDFLVQEFIDLPNECGIFYIRRPSESKGKIVSVGIKKFCKVEGDGISTVRELMLEKPRTKLQIQRLEITNADLLNVVVPRNDWITIEPIGNHSRGTGFFDGNHLISDELDDLFDSINHKMKEVYYGRFDVKYDTWEKLLKGEDLKILEMNGIASEPIHVYDDKIKIRDKYKSFYKLWRYIYEISAIQKKRGIDPINVFAAIKAFREYKKHINSINPHW